MVPLIKVTVGFGGGVGGRSISDFKWQRWWKDFFGFEIFDLGIFGGFGFWFLPPFDHPCHLKSGLPPAPSHPLVFCYQSEEILRAAPTQLLGRGDRNRLIEMIALIQIRFSVIKENDFWDFGKWTQLMEVRLIQVCLQLIHPKLERPTLKRRFGCHRHSLWSKFTPLCIVPKLCILVIL